jgi:hypothetical protein
MKVFLRRIGHASAFGPVFILADARDFAGRGGVGRSFAEICLVSASVRKI